MGHIFYDSASQFLLLFANALTFTCTVATKLQTLRQNSVSL